MKEYKRRVDRLPELTVRFWPKSKYAYVKFQDRWVQLHHYVWELYNGPVPNGFDVHHRTKEEGGMGKKCNCICNLELISHAGHTAAHKTGAVIAESTRLKISQNNGRGFLGRKHSSETKEKMRLKRLGRPLSEETKRRMSLSHRAHLGEKFQSE